jgi:hypothetical protein
LHFDSQKGKDNAAACAQVMSTGQQPKKSFIKREISVRGIGIPGFVGRTVVAHLSVVSPLLAAHVMP